MMSPGEFVDIDRPVPSTLYRDDLIIEIINLITRRESILLLGNPKYGKTNMIENVILPFLNNEHDTEPIVKAFANKMLPAAKKLNYDYLYIQDDLKKRVLIEAVNTFEMKSGKKADLGTNPSMGTAALVFKNLIREYIRERRLLAYYIVLKQCKMDDEALGFIATLDDIVKFVVELDSETAMDFYKTSFYQKCSYVVFQAFTPEEARSFGMIMMEKENVYCCKDVYEGFLQLNHGQGILGPGEIVERVRILKQQIMDYASRHIKFTYQSLRELFPYAQNNSNRINTVPVHLVVAYLCTVILFWFCHPYSYIEILKYAVSGGFIVVGIFGFNLWERRNRTTKIQYMRSR